MTILGSFFSLVGTILLAYSLNSVITCLHASIAMIELQEESKEIPGNQIHFKNKPDFVAKGVATSARIVKAGVLFSVLGTVISIVAQIK